MKRLICHIKAFVDFLKYGVYVPHVYEENAIKRANIAYTADYFRIVEGYQHEPDEQLAEDAVVITCNCIFCGKEEIMWSRKEDWNDKK